MNRRLALLCCLLAAFAMPAIVDAGPRGHGGRGAGWRGGGAGPARPAARGGAVFGPPRGFRGGYGPPPVYYRSRPAPTSAWRPRQDSLGAGWRQQQDEARSGVRQGGWVRLDSVRTRIAQRFPGRLLDAGIEQGWRGQPVYRVRWAARNGRRMDIIVDARSGAILDTEGR